ncbi:VOC family protein [Actinomadura craniellae]|uniref:VOC family protein n=1 Tax=Actinomadura craniellae TaxID=2231787 RepID=A0A365HAP5_9ACTN|nr:VOC family protein [Actinomadura craniellae]RAY16078.1 VOC family protein [Actinomadura craniellae]
MQPRVDLITLGVPDLAAARRFYVEGLGWEPMTEVEGEIVFLQVGHGLALALFGAEDLEKDLGGTAPAGGPTGMTLAHNVGGEKEVVEVMNRAAAAGAAILKEPQPAAFGGFHGYFADPAGFRWEVCHNPGWSVGPDGRPAIVPVDG